VIDEFEYSNGACGSCQECGEPVDEEWHAFCSDCFAEQNGWRRPDASALERQRDERERVSITQLAARLGELEMRIRRLERERAA
jgi:hypothetical protein